MRRSYHPEKKQRGSSGRRVHADPEIRRTGLGKRGGRQKRMTDEEIIRLLWNRDETAVTEMEHTYGGYCYRISWEITQNREDVHECMNDTWLKTWYSIPDKRPDSLRTFVGRITRNLSLNRVIHDRAKKRGSGTVSLVYEELSEMLGDEEDPIENMISRQAFAERINTFLDRQSRMDRAIFILRFWYFYSPKEIAKQLGVGEKAVYNALYQLRKRFAAYWNPENG